MPQATTCPSCGARLHLRDELIGRRVKCPKCGEKFDATAASSAPTAPAVYAPPTGSSPPSASQPQGLSPGARLAMQTGVTGVVTGVLGLVLPFVGLQVRALNNLGDKAPAVAIGLIIFGGVLIGLAQLRRHLGAGVTRTIKWIVLGGGAAVVLLIAVLVVISMSLRATRHSPPTFSNSSSRPPAPRAAGPAGPAGPGSPPDVVYDSMVRQYGAEKVWRVVMSSRPVGPELGQMHSKVAQFCSKHRPARFMIGAHDGLPASTVAPIEKSDAEELAQALDLGAGPASVDADQQTISVKVKS